MSEIKDLPTAIDTSEVQKERKKSWSQSEKVSLRIYEFTKLIKDSLGDLKGRTIEDIMLGFIPPGHPDRGLIDMGWRILIFFEDDENLLCINPTAAYSSAFMSAAPEDIKLEMLLDELNSLHAEGRIRVLQVPEETEVEE